MLLLTNYFSNKVHLQHTVNYAADPTQIISGIFTVTGLITDEVFSYRTPDLACRHDNQALRYLHHFQNSPHSLQLIG